LAGITGDYVELHATGQGVMSAASLSDVEIRVTVVKK
jgi:hypothetical protein